MFTPATPLTSRPACSQESLDWPAALDARESAFHARFCGLPAGSEAAAETYMAHELSLLADVETHLAICLSSVGAIWSSEAPSSEMLLRFSADELSHAQVFRHMVAILAGAAPGQAPDLPVRIDLFRGPESPAVKLAALLASAYPGESLITTFERRALRLDPEKRHFLTRLLVAHGRDEARHIQVDHQVFRNVVPKLTDLDAEHACRLCQELRRRNQENSAFHRKAVEAMVGPYRREANPAARYQDDLTRRLTEATQPLGLVMEADEVLGMQDRARLLSFTGSAAIHDLPEAP